VVAGAVFAALPPHPTIAPAPKSTAAMIPIVCAIEAIGPPIATLEG
jgi:hypothetical protein